MNSAPLVIASNRGPVEFQPGPDGGITERRGGGGLIAVLGPALASNGGVWVAGALTETDRIVARRAQAEGQLLTVQLPQGPVLVRSLDLEPDAFRSYYGPIGTQTLWFLHHHLFDLTRLPLFGAAFRADWRAYEQINDRFAAACAEEAAPNATVLLQDYHLAVAPAQLRARRPDLRIAHFTMCPWAEPGYFRVLPEWTARRLIEGMLGADMLAFLVPRWADHFLACCRELGYEVDGTSIASRGAAGVTRVRTYPVGVDVAELQARAAQQDVRAELQWVRELIGDRRLLLRVDRMEPAKNILRGVHAFAELLAARPDLHGRVVHYVLAYSSRSEMELYRRYAEDVHAAVEDTNRRFGSSAWQPVILDTRNNFERGLALMARADAVVVNPLRDGMNLVAKEAPSVSEHDVAVILSREAGAVDELAEGAIVINPFDTGELTEAIGAALTMPAAERRRRVELLRRSAGALPPVQWLKRVLADMDGLAPRIIPGGGPKTSTGSSSTNKGVGDPWR